MITIKNTEQIRAMRKSGMIAGGALKAAGDAVCVGITTKELDQIVRSYIKERNATPSFLNYGGFPAAACISINDQVIHGIPSNIKLAEGDLVKIDIGAYYNGFHSDNAATYCVGVVSDEARLLADTAKNAFFKGLEFARDGMRLGDIASAIQIYTEGMGFSVVRDFVGHGIGSQLHEDPGVPNFGTAGRGLRLKAGMTIAVEPMINAGDFGVWIKPDKWTVMTNDGSLSAHYEHTIAITEGNPIILTEL